MLLWKRNREKSKGAIVLARRPGGNGLFGLVETSLFMRWSPTRVRFWWTDFIADASLGVTVNVNGMNDAEWHAMRCRRDHPDWEITVWEAHDDHLPVSIDWKEWAESNDKYTDRNPSFVMK